MKIVNILRKALINVLLLGTIIGPGIGFAGPFTVQFVNNTGHNIVIGQTETYSIMISPRGDFFDSHFHTLAAGATSAPQALSATTTGSPSYIYLAIIDADILAIQDQIYLNLPQNTKDLPTCSPLPSGEPDCRKTSLSINTNVCCGNNLQYAIGGTHQNALITITTL